jgi:hypothetical protein
MVVTQNNKSVKDTLLHSLSAFLSNVLTITMVTEDYTYDIMVTEDCLGAQRP